MNEVTFSNGRTLKREDFPSDVTFKNACQIERERPDDFDPTQRVYFFRNGKKLAVLEGVCPVCNKDMHEVLKVNGAELCTPPPQSTAEEIAHAESELKFIKGLANQVNKGEISIVEAASQLLMHGVRSN